MNMQKLKNHIGIRIIGGGNCSRMLMSDLVAIWHQFCIFRLRLKRYFVLDSKMTNDAKL
jgi:hypothetical protein